MTVSLVKSIPKFDHEVIKKFVNPFNASVDE